MLFVHVHSSMSELTAYQYVFSVMISHRLCLSGNADKYTLNASKPSVRRLPLGMFDRSSSWPKPLVDAAYHIRYTLVKVQCDSNSVNVLADVYHGFSNIHIHMNGTYTADRMRGLQALMHLFRVAIFYDEQYTSASALPHGRVPGLGCIMAFGHYMVRPSVFYRQQWFVKYPFPCRIYNRGMSDVSLHTLVDPSAQRILVVTDCTLTLDMWCDRLRGDAFSIRTPKVGSYSSVCAQWQSWESKVAVVVSSDQLCSLDTWTTECTDTSSTILTFNPSFMSNADKLDALRSAHVRANPWSVNWDAVVLLYPQAKWCAGVRDAVRGIYHQQRVVVHHSAFGDLSAVSVDNMYDICTKDETSRQNLMTYRISIVRGMFDESDRSASPDRRNMNIHTHVKMTHYERTLYALQYTVLGKIRLCKGHLQSNGVSTTVVPVNDKQTQLRHRTDVHKNRMAIYKRKKNTEEQTQENRAYTYFSATNTDNTVACVVCESTKHPVTFCCGHSVCHRCSTRVSACPICRRRITLRYMSTTDVELKRRSIYGSKLAYVIEWLENRRDKKVLLCSQFSLPGAWGLTLRRMGHRTGTVRLCVKQRARSEASAIRAIESFMQEGSKSPNLLLVSGYWEILPHMCIKCDHVIVVSHLCDWYIQGIHSRLRHCDHPYLTWLCMLQHTIEGMTQTANTSIPVPQCHAAMASI